MQSESGLKRTTWGDWFIVFLMVLLIILCILPILNVAATAFSSTEAVQRQQVAFLPVGFQTQSVMTVLSDTRFMQSLAWTATLTVMVVIINLTMTVLLAYPLTYMTLKGRKIISFYVVFTMLFSAGLIPAFVLFRNLNLIDNPLVLILPGMISVFNMVIIRNFFLGIPDSLRESAEMDGAGPMTVLLKIYLPLSTPVLATVGLFYGVGRWNGFQDALFFLTGAPDWHPIQLLLFNILNNIVAVDPLDPGASMPPGWGQTIESAAIVVATAPILAVYPFLQKYFVQGATLGAVKG